MIDCIVGMSAERYFADETIKIGRPIIPSVIFSVLSGTSFAYLIFGIIALHFESIRDLLILRETQAKTFLAEHLKGSLDLINPASILIIRPDIPVNDFALGFAVFVIFVFSRYIFAAIFLILNAIQPQMTESSISEKQRQNNKVILRCIFAQFVGFCLLATLPSFIIVMNFYFRSKPNCINALCFLFMNCFSLYDIIVTVICIKSYRLFVIQIGDYILSFWSNQKLNTVIPKSPIFTTNVDHNNIDPTKPKPIVYGKTVYCRIKC
uniref:Uncharacterized protein n=1 Tax=Panagrolaimus davidi TaxID=227884 RepID=A0A914QGQ2_9BILA